MTYKESVDILEMMIRQRSLVNGTPEPKIDRKELMVMLSMAQSDIQSTHKVSMETKQIGYISGENTYNLSQDLTLLVE